MSAIPPFFVKLACVIYELWTLFVLFPLTYLIFIYITHHFSIHIMPVCNNTFFKNICLNILSVKGRRKMSVKNNIDQHSYEVRNLYFYVNKGKFISIRILMCIDTIIIWCFGNMQISCYVNLKIIQYHN